MVQRECCRINYSWFTFEINTASFCYANEKEGDGRGGWRFEPLDAIFSTQKQSTFLSAFLSSLLRFLWRERLQNFQGFQMCVQGSSINYWIIRKDTVPKQQYPCTMLLSHHPWCCHIQRCTLRLLLTALTHCFWAFRPVKERCAQPKSLLSSFFFW